MSTPLQRAHPPRWPPAVTLVMLLRTLSWQRIATALTHQQNQNASLPGVWKVVTFLPYGERLRAGIVQPGGEKAQRRPHHHGPGHKRCSQEDGDSLCATSPMEKARGDWHRLLGRLALDLRGKCFPMSTDGHWNHLPKDVSGGFPTLGSFKLGRVLGAAHSDCTDTWKGWAG